MSSRDSPDERAAIIGAAWDVLERSGFEGFKVQLVLKKAAVSARTFYRYFEDKDALLVALLQDEMSRAGSRLRLATERGADPVEAVRAWIRAVIGAAGDPRRVARARLFSSQQALFRRFSHELDAGERLLIAPLEEALVEGRAAGAFPWAEPATDAALIYRLTGGALTDALADRPGQDIEAVILRTTAFALRALGAPGDP